MHKCTIVGASNDPHASAFHARTLGIVQSIMGTDKRARQKANRAQKVAQQQVQDKQDSRKRSLTGFGVVVGAVIVIAGLIYLTSGNSDDTASTASTTTAAVTVPTTVTTKLTATPFKFGTTACPPEAGAKERTLTFAAPPKNCLVAGKSYTATFDTTAGKIIVDLDTKKTPGTANNFVFLARHRYYDNTKLFRVSAGIDIIQGGSPHTQSASDPGPGYQLLDEGKFNADASQGEYTYSAGDLVMARTTGPNGASAQFFFVTGPKGANLDAQGTYVVFGHVTSGLEALQKIVATAKVDASGEGTPNPEVTIKKVAINQK